MYNIVQFIISIINLCSHKLYNVQYELTFSAGYLQEMFFEFFYAKLPMAFFSGISYFIEAFQ